MLISILNLFLDISNSSFVQFQVSTNFIFPFIGSNTALSDKFDCSDSPFSIQIIVTKWKSWQIHEGARMKQFEITSVNQTQFYGRSLHVCAAT